MLEITKGPGPGEDIRGAWRGVPPFVENMISYSAKVPPVLGGRVVLRLGIFSFLLMQVLVGACLLLCDLVTGDGDSAASWICVTLVVWGHVFLAIAIVRREIRAAPTQSLHWLDFLAIACFYLGPLAWAKQRRKSRDRTFSN